jgi:hypothetical protein
MIPKATVIKLEKNFTSITIIELGKSLCQCKNIFFINLVIINEEKISKEMTNIMIT